eukprot:6186507-Pleurochrysis_carterae.AAC.1
MSTLFAGRSSSASRDIRPAGPLCQSCGGAGSSVRPVGERASVLHGQPADDASRRRRADAWRTARESPRAGAPMLAQ